MSPEELRAAIERTRASWRMASSIDRPWLACQLADLFAVSRDTEPMPVARDDEPAGHVLGPDGRKVELVNGAGYLTDDPNVCPRCGNVWECCTCPPEPPGSPDRYPAAMNGKVTR